jgi:biotin synthase
MKKTWNSTEIKAIYQKPLMELIDEASQIHKQYHSRREIQTCHLISIKTGGCPEDCSYCAQSARYQTGLKSTPLMAIADVVEKARQAVTQGATRVCLGAAWREVRDTRQFDAVLEMIKAIAALDVEVCCTLGLLNEKQAQKLAEAGLYAYNHNLDTSERFYKTIITTRTYADRLKTLNCISKVGLKMCCGGILGLGETEEDRIDLLCHLAVQIPESIPINLLTPMQGTPLAEKIPLSIWEVIRFIAAVRCVIPTSMIRLAAGRLNLSLQDQALCFIAGANSIFTGEKLLTSANPSFEQDADMLHILGLSIKS